MTTPQRVESPFACPNCGSENTKALALVHSSGVHSGASSLGIGSSHSAVALAAAPPKVTTPATFLWAGAITAAGIIGGAYFLSEELGPLAIVPAVIVFGIFGVLAIGARKRVRDVYAPALAKWQRSFLCERCAAVFERA